MWFCLKDEVISVDKSQHDIPKMTKQSICDGKVQQSCTDVYQKGKSKVKQSFYRMLYEKFNVFVHEQQSDANSESTV